jgi:hypothetical protein
MAHVYGSKSKKINSMHVTISKVISFSLYQRTSHWDWEAPQSQGKSRNFEPTHNQNRAIYILAYRRMFLLFKNFIKSSHYPWGDWAGEFESN